MITRDLVLLDHWPAGLNNELPYQSVTKLNLHTTYAEFKILLDKNMPKERNKLLRVEGNSIHQRVQGHLMKGDNGTW